MVGNIGLKCDRCGEKVISLLNIGYFKGERLSEQEEDGYIMLVKRGM